MFSDQKPVEIAKFQRLTGGKRKGLRNERAMPTGRCWEGALSILNQTRLGECHPSHQRGTSLTRLFGLPAIMAASLPPVPGVTLMVTRVMDTLLSGYLVLVLSNWKPDFSMDEARRLIIAFYSLRPLQKAIYQLHLTPEISSSLHSCWNCMKFIFNHCLRGISSLPYSSLEPSQMMTQVPASEEGYSVLWTSAYYPSPLSIVYILNPAVRIYISASKAMPGFACGSFKCAYLYRKGSGWGCSTKQQEPRGKHFETSRPRHSNSFHFFYSWDNATKHSSKI